MPATLKPTTTVGPERRLSSEGYRDMVQSRALTLARVAGGNAAAVTVATACRDHCPARRVAFWSDVRTLVARRAATEASPCTYAALLNVGGF